MRIEFKVVGVAVYVFTKLDVGAAQPEYVPANVAEVSNAWDSAKRKTATLSETFTVPPKGELKPNI